MTDDLRERATALLGTEFRGLDNYFELFGDRLKMDGEFTLAELRAIVEAWEEMTPKTYMVYADGTVKLNGEVTDFKLDSSLGLLDATAAATWLNSGDRLLFEPGLYKEGIEVGGKQ